MESKQEIEHLLREYKHLILKQDINETTQKNGKKVLIVKLVFSDQAKLETFESEWQNKRKYQYQWMRQDNTLLISWGNDHHHPEIPTHPDHKHVESRQNVQASEPMNLRKVLEYIAKIMASILLIILGLYLLA